MDFYDFNSESGNFPLYLKGSLLNCSLNCSLNGISGTKI